MTNAYDTEHDNQIAYLLKLAGRRPAPARERIERARAAARTEWVRQRAIDRWRRVLMLVGMAAGITLIGGISLWRWSAPAVDRPEVAIVQRIAGTVRIAAADVGARQPLTGPRRPHSCRRSDRRGAGQSRRVRVLRQFGSPRRHDRGHVRRRPCVALSRRHLRRCRSGAQRAATRRRHAVRTRQPLQHAVRASARRAQS